MYARLVRFNLGPGNRDLVQSLADNIVPKIAALPGCHGVYAFTDDSDGQSGLFVLWDSEANANSAAAAIRPQLNHVIEGNVQGEVEARLFEVLTK